MTDFVSGTGPGYITHAGLRVGPGRQTRRSRAHKARRRSQADLGGNGEGGYDRPLRRQSVDQ